MVRGGVVDGPVALATSAPRRIIETVMDAMGIGRLVPATVSTAEVATGKPSPDVYREAMRGGHPTLDSFAVEDSSNGIRAAAAAGLTVLAVHDVAYPLAPDAVAPPRVHVSLDSVGRQLREPCSTRTRWRRLVTRVYNAERGFKDEFLEGLTAAYGRYSGGCPTHRQ